RQGKILYMPSFILIRDLKEQIIARIKEKTSNIELFNQLSFSSERWIGYQFFPKNPWARVSTEYVVKYQEYVAFIFADDKHKIPIGEGSPTSTGVCNHDQHYKEFLELYGQKTTEQFRPSNSKVLLNEQNNDTNTRHFVNNLIHMLVECDFCGKYRCIYSQTLLDDQEMDLLTTYLEDISYKLKDNFKNIYPLCNSCQENGYKWSTRAPKIHDKIYK
ncbi:14000_t:CDS:2, partial [Racocetra fulgida]